MAIDGKKKRAAKLTTFMISQDYLPEHWAWSDAEKQALGNCTATAQVILSRLTSAGLNVSEAYAITHDKDEKAIWDEYTNQYRTNFISKHIHFLGKLAEGETLESLADIIGVTSNYIEKPKSGRYAYDNMLSYLIHIKYPQKYQYDPHDVVVLIGKDYIEYFRENRARWMHGRAEKIIQDEEITYKVLRIMISEGRVTREEVFTRPEFNQVLHDHLDAIVKLFNNHETILSMRQRPELFKRT